MKNFFKILLAAVFVLTSCSKEKIDTLSGTKWRSDNLTETYETKRVEILFTESAFSMSITFPQTPSYPPRSVTGTYTYEYPYFILYVQNEIFTTGTVSADRKSLTISPHTFIRLY